MSRGVEWPWRTEGDDEPASPLNGTRTLPGVPDILPRLAPIFPLLFPPFVSGGRPQTEVGTFLRVSTSVQRDVLRSGDTV